VVEVGIDRNEVTTLSPFSGVIWMSILKNIRLASFGFLGNLKRHVENSRKITVREIVEYVTTTITYAGISFSMHPYIEMLIDKLHDELNSYKKCTEKCRQKLLLLIELYQLLVATSIFLEDYKDELREYEAGTRELESIMKRIKIKL